jgi:hypothetical protein
VIFRRDTPGPLLPVPNRTRLGLLYTKHCNPTHITHPLGRVPYGPRGLRWSISRRSGKCAPREARPLKHERYPRAHAHTATELYLMQSAAGCRRSAHVGSARRLKKQARRVHRAVRVFEPNVRGIVSDDSTQHIPGCASTPSNCAAGTRSTRLVTVSASARRVGYTLSLLSLLANVRRSSRRLLRISRTKSLSSSAAVLEPSRNTSPDWTASQSVNFEQLIFVILGNKFEVAGPAKQAVSESQVSVLFCRVASCGAEQAQSSGRRRPPPCRSRALRKTKLLLVSLHLCNRLPLILACPVQPPVSLHPSSST